MSEERIPEGEQAAAEAAVNELIAKEAAKQKAINELKADEEARKAITAEALASKVESFATKKDLVDTIETLRKEQKDIREVVLRANAQGKLGKANFPEEKQNNNDELKKIYKGTGILGY